MDGPLDLPLSKSLALQRDLQRTTPKPTRKGPRPSAETIRKRICLMIGSGNVDRLDKEGFAVVPVSLLLELVGFTSLLDPAKNGDGSHE